MNEIYHDCVNMIAQNWQIDKSDVPEILAQWCVFEQKHGQFSNVKLKIAKSSMDFWSDSPEFASKFYLFTDYTDTYDSCALWNDGNKKPLSEMPVVALGDDGYLGIIADNLGSFLRMLSSGYLCAARNNYKANGDELERYCPPLEWLPFENDLPQNYFAFMEFMQNELHLMPDPSPNESLLKAYHQYNFPFIQWCNQYNSWKIDFIKDK